MFIKKVAFAAALALASTSLAQAQGFDPNLGNSPDGGETTWLPPSQRHQSAPIGLYPRPSGSIRPASVARRETAGTHGRPDAAFQTAPVRLYLGYPGGM